MRAATGLLTASILSFAGGPAFAQAALTNADVMAIHDRLLTIDSHVDIATGYGTASLDPGAISRAQVDLPSMRIAGLDAGLFIVYTPQGELTEEGYAHAVETAEEKYRGILRMLRANADTIALATTADEVEALNAEGKLIALIGIENGYPLGTTPRRWPKRSPCGPSAARGTSRSPTSATTSSAAPPIRPAPAAMPTTPA
jgi:hypothetical protein